MGRALNGKNAKRGVLGSDSVLHIHSTLLLPSLDSVHVREFKDDDAVGRWVSKYAQSFVEPSSQELASMVGDVLQRGLEEVLFVALLISDRDLRYYESGRLGLGVQYLDGATSDQQAKSYGCRNLKNAFIFPLPRKCTIAGAQRTPIRRLRIAPRTSR